MMAPSAAAAAAPWKPRAVLWAVLLLHLISLRQAQAFSGPLRMVASRPQAPTKKQSKRRSKGGKSLQKQPTTNATPRRNSSISTNDQSQQPQTTSTTAPKTIGEAVQQAQTTEALLQVAEQLWLPTDPDLKPHLKNQAIHHEKRQRWSAQLLAKLGEAPLYSSSTTSKIIWQDDRLARAVLAAALPFDPPQENTDLPQNSQASSALQNLAGNDKEHRAVREAVVGLHTLAGVSQAHTTDDVHPDVLQGVQLLLTRCEAMAHDISLPEVVEVRWAARGLLARLGPSVEPCKVPLKEDEQPAPKQQQLSHREYQAAVLPNLEQRVEGLPFDILPQGVDLSHLDSVQDDNTLSSSSSSQANTQEEIMASLQESIPFQFDTIVTRHGDNVQERRGTAWVAKDGIGALAYSGKLMPPSPLPPLVSQIMRYVEDAIDAPLQPFFDCALCNFYPDGESACKFHTDPEHGLVWERLTCVVAVGNPRKFAFRPIETCWRDWESSQRAETRVEESSSTNIPAVIRLFTGDIVVMQGTCNDDFHHAVYPENTPQEVTEGVRNNDLGRISLVLKRALARGSNGKRGHSLAGEGRRSRRKQSH